MMLMLTTLACYSDNSLGLFELTPAPPTVTPLPTPLPNQAQFKIGDLAWAPASVTEAAFRLDLTTVPEPLAADLSNKSPQSCSQNSLLRILYSGIHENGQIYYLVDCRGVAGWTPGDNLLGPITIVANDRALTTEAGVDPSGAFKIELSDPPYRENDPFRQKADCKVNDTVDVLAMSGYSTGELYYKIRCAHPFNPVAQNVGWTTAEALFGPVRFRNGETGLVARESESINLVSEPNGDNIVATCQQDELVKITTTPVVRLDNDLFYEVECVGGKGWTNQDVLVGPIPFEVGTQVLVTAPGVNNSAEARQPIQAETEEPAADGGVTAEASPSDLPTIPSVALTSQPEPLLLDNQVGECPDAAVTTVQAFAGVGGRLYAQVECGGTVGWLDETVLYGPVLYDVGETVMLGEKAIIGFGDRGIYLSIKLFDIEGRGGGSEVIAGDCAIDFETLEPIEATLKDIGYYRSSTGNIVGVFYWAACQDWEGNTIEGWINQDRIGE